MLNPMYTANMTDQQRVWFYAEYKQASKDETVGVLLALFLGGLGIHKFYMGQTTAGVLYLVFSWTGIPTIIGFVECFLMPGRVRTYNAMQAQMIAAGIMGSGQPSQPAPIVAAVPRACPGCGGVVQPGAGFCAKCGSAVMAAG